MRFRLLVPGSINRSIKRITGSMIAQRDIVIVGLQPWEIQIGSNCKNLAIEFSRLNRVLYVNSPRDSATAWRKKWNGQGVDQDPIDGSVTGKQRSLLRKVGDNILGL